MNRLSVMAIATLLAGCDRVSEHDAWAEAREAARTEVAEYWFADAKDPPPGAGARIAPRSLVKVLVEGLDPADGKVLHRHELLALVPSPAMFPGYHFDSPHGPQLCGDPCFARLKKRGVGSDPAAGPAIVTQWSSMPLPYDAIYRMRAGGTYELPHPTMAALRGLNEKSERPFPGLPKVRYTVLSACPADLRRVEFTYLDWRHDFIQYPSGFRTVTWHELHGCRR